MLRRSLRCSWLILLMVGVIALSTFAQAQTRRFVSTTGDDGSGTGSAGQPWRTISHALLQAGAGDTIDIAAGIYAEGLTITTNGIALEGRGTVLLRPDLLTAVVDGGRRCAMLITNASGVSVSNLTIEGGTLTDVLHCGILARNTPSLALRRLSLRYLSGVPTGGGGVGVFFEGAGQPADNVLIEDCVFRRMDRAAVELAISAPSPSTALLVSNGMRISGCSIDSVCLGGSAAAAGGALSLAGIAGARIERNVIGMVGAPWAAITIVGSAADNKILRNTVVRAQIGVDVHTASTAVDFTLRGHVPVAPRIALNDLAGATGVGVLVRDLSAQYEVDARNNYWGANTGPLHPVTNAAGTGVAISDNARYRPWSGRALLDPNPTLTQTSLDIASPLFARLQVSPLVVPRFAGRVDVTHLDALVDDISIPPGTTTAYVDVQAATAQRSFDVRQTLRIETGPGTLLMQASDTSLYRVLRHEASSGMWLPLVDAQYTQLPVQWSAPDSAFLTFRINHAGLYSLSGGSDLPFANSLHQASTLYLAKRPDSREGMLRDTAHTFVPNVTWGGGYANRLNDWGFTGTQVLRAFLVPDTLVRLGAFSMSLDWPDGLLDSVVTVVTQHAGNRGLFDAATHPVGMAPLVETERLLRTYGVHIDAARFDNTNYDPAATGSDRIRMGDFLVAVDFTLRRPGGGTVDARHADLRRFMPGQAPEHEYGRVMPLRVRAYLGDVVAQVAPNIVDDTRGDGRVDIADLAVWSSSYWSGVPGFAGGLTNYKRKFDVGPTQDAYIFSLPVPDTRIEFEDLMIFSMTYGMSANHVLPKRGTAMPVEDAAVQVALEEEYIHAHEKHVVVRVTNGTGVKGMALRLLVDKGFVIGVSEGPALSRDSQKGVLFSLQLGDTLLVDLAALGANGQTMHGDGVVAVIRLSTDAELRLLAARARDVENQPMMVKGQGNSQPERLDVTQPHPNPFAEHTVFAVTLPRATTLTVQVHDVLGRLVATLTTGQHEAGWYQYVWDGRNRHGVRMPVGLYLVRVATEHAAEILRVVLK
jgi:hypothetical protein